MAGRIAGTVAGASGSGWVGGGAPGHVTVASDLTGQARPPRVKDRTPVTGLGCLPPACSSEGTRMDPRISSADTKNASPLVSGFRCWREKVTRLLVTRAGNGYGPDTARTGEWVRQTVRGMGRAVARRVASS